MKPKSVPLVPLFVAALMALSGGALAQSGGTARPPPPSAGAAGDATAKPAAPPNSIVGRDVVDNAGQKIGEVDAVSGDRVVVSTGGFLGIGERRIALDWNQLALSGTGSDVKVRTALTKAQIKAMPEYKKPASTSPPAKR